MNETTTGAPLTATLGERVGDDPHVKEVREEVAQASAPPAQEPGAATREGLPASRGASEGKARRPRRRREGGAATRPFPWGALALAAVGWALVTGIGRGLRSRARRVGRGARRLVHAEPR
jgi:hypothetical protein